MELGRKLNVPVPTTAVANEFLTAARGMGWEKLDYAVISMCWRGCRELKREWENDDRQR